MDDLDAELTKLVPDYVAARRLELPLLRALLADHRLEEVHRLAHRMKGTGATYGLSEVTRLGAAIESAALAGHEDEIRALLDQLDGSSRPNPGTHLC